MPIATDPTCTGVRANGITINVAHAGAGPAVLLLHGWPHTWELWRHLIGGLATDRTVLAPDLRGMGATSRPDHGYDVETLVADAVGVLDAFGIGSVAVVGTDVGAPVAFMLALTHPERVRGVALFEGLLGPLPGAQSFLAAGPPWWFGFHAVPGLAERALVGQEDRYLDWFLGAHAARPIDPAIRDAFVAAYRGEDALRGGFEHYRARVRSGDQITAAARAGRLTVPALAIAGGVVGDAVRAQLEPLADDLRSVTIADCGHLVALEQPGRLAAALRDVV